MSEPLANDAHERFCEEYLVDLNATAAYLRGYPHSSAAAARNSASALMANPDIADRIAELQVERAERVQVRLDDVLRELLLIAHSDVTQYGLDDLGHLELQDGAPATAWRAVQSVKYRITSNGDFTTREVEYRLWNKNDALKQLREHLRGVGAGDEDDVIPLATLRKAIQRAAARRAS